MPGPASTVGERPPTNPAIRLRFPVLLSRRFTQYYAKPQFIGKKRNTPSTGKKSGLQLSLCMKKERTLKIGPMGQTLRGGLQTILLYYALYKAYG